LRENKPAILYRRGASNKYLPVFESAKHVLFPANVHVYGHIIAMLRRNSECRVGSVSYGGRALHIIWIAKKFASEVLDSPQSFALPQILTCFAASGRRR
jgi:hypothetical protein